MVEGKTSGLFALPVSGAADLCGASQSLVEALAESARHLGVLFQIQDDVLDLYGDKGRASRGSDIGEGKRSVLVMHALEKLGSEEGEELSTILDKPRQETSAQDISRVIELFAQVGSLQYALAEVARRRQAALASEEIKKHPRLAELVEGICELFLAPIRPLVESHGAGQETAA
jgi:geranylgeranyl diphosphate synthase type I